MPALRVQIAQVTQFDAGLFRLADGKWKAVLGVRIPKEDPNDPKGRPPYIEKTRFKIYGEQAKRVWIPIGKGTNSPGIHQRMFDAVRKGLRASSCYCVWPPELRLLDTVETAVAQPAELEAPASVETILCREAVYQDGVEDTKNKTKNIGLARRRGVLRGVLKDDNLTDARCHEILQDAHKFLKCDLFFAEHFVAGILRLGEKSTLIIAYVREPRPDTNPYQRIVGKWYTTFKDVHGYLKKGQSTIKEVVQMRKTHHKI